MTADVPAGWLRALEASAPAAAMRASGWLFPLVETLHIIGFTVLAGAVILFDLRLMGFAPTLAPGALARHLLRWAWAAFALVLPTGVLLFSTEARTLASNPAFGTKLVLLALAGANALAFHWGAGRALHGWSAHRPLPRGAWWAGALSVLLWLGVIVCGRWIAYV